MNTIIVTSRTPGGREEEENFTWEEFFEFLTDCATSVSHIREALGSGTFRVHEILYEWEPESAFKSWATPKIETLPQPEPQRPFSPEACKAVTFPFSQELSDEPAHLRPTQGVSFHARDIDEENVSVRGVGRGLLEGALWKHLLSIPRAIETEYGGFHLGNQVDQYQVRLEGKPLRKLAALLEKSRYRPAREMLEYLHYHNPQSVELIFSCRRE